MKTPDPTFPFVIGSPRSGTTLLRAMLDSHPELAIPPESHFIPSSIGTPGELVRRLQDNDKFQRWGISLEGIDQAPAYADAVRAVYARFSASRGKSRYGDKTPDYALHVPLLAALFPESKFVHLVRDGRNVAPSIVEAGFAKNFKKATLMWRRFVSAGRLAGSGLTDRYLEVSYEKLVEDPEKALQGICDFLQLAYDDRMLRYPDRIDSVIPNLPSTNPLRGRPTNTLRDWRQQLTPEQLRMFERLAGDCLKAFGYQPATRRRTVQQHYERLRVYGSHWRARREALSAFGEVAAQ